MNFQEYLNEEQKQSKEDFEKGLGEYMKFKYSNTSERARKKRIKAGIEQSKIFENDKAIVMHITNFEDSCKYGTGTNWCISNKSMEIQWDAYNKDHNVYMILPKDKSDKVGVLVDENGTKKIYDAKDKEHDVKWLNDFCSKYDIPFKVLQA